MEALKKSPTPSVEMKPSDKGWSWLKGDGITIRIGMEKLDDHGNGSRLGLVIQNPLARSEEHTSELQSLMRISYAVFCLKQKKQNTNKRQNNKHTIYAIHSLLRT